MRPNLRETPEAPTRPPGDPVESRPSDLEARLDQIEKQDVGAPGEHANDGTPSIKLPGEDEGPLGEGGQLREGWAGSAS